MIALDPLEMKVTETTIDGQTRRVMEKIKVILEENQLSMADLYKLRVWLRDIAHKEEADQIIQSYLPKNEDNSISVAISYLGLFMIPRPEAMIEIDFETFKNTRSSE